MRDGSGDELFIIFTSNGAVIKGFAHEAPMSPYVHNPPRVWSGVLETVPDFFTQLLIDPAFSITNTTFCIWRTYQDTAWQCGNIKFSTEEDPDGSAGLLAIFDGKPETYQVWAEYYYEQPVALAAVAHIYEHGVLTNEIISQLNSDASLKALEDDIREIGYNFAK